MTNYVHKYDDDGSELECESCGYHTWLGKFRKEWRRGEEDGDRLLCEVCSSTFLASHLDSPSHVSDPTLYKSIGYIANMILDEIRRSKE